MNKAQIIVLSIAVAAGGGAFMLMNGSSPPPPPVIAAAPAMTEEVLVAARDLAYGVPLKDSDTSWIQWPKEAVPKGALRKSETPSAKDDLKAYFVRAPISAGEPIRTDRLVKGQTAGLMASLLSPGKRAVAIDVSLNTTAGGFILPNDRVDVLTTFRDQELTRERGVEVLGSELLVSNVRILAMGQTVETRNGESVVTGATATLELDARQAELVMLAQRTGQLALALRPVVDEQSSDATVDYAGGNLTIVRGGVPSTQRFK